jgi:alkyl hydroperoxide reductase subunit AhpC
MGALENWRPEFEKLGVHVIAATIDYVTTIKDWFTNDELLQDAKYPVISSRILPQRLGLLRSDGSLRRSSVFVMQNGEMVRIEHFDRVGRSLAELHRMAYAYTQDSYCAEGWQSPEDGFLTPPEE